MGMSLSRPSRQRTMAWLLVAAFLPSLVFAGHWPAIAVAIPGTGWSIGLPAAGHAHAPAGSGHAHDQHAEHCHADMATCAGQPFTGGATVAALQEITLAAVVGGLLVAVALAALPAWRGHAPPPPFEPPRPGLRLP